ncbi:ejaculatory bulb-specific protein 3-like isoform X2 [Cimex lectularius]|uniref:Chemosensory protein n=1 Tax=Cimex lectularius TaxID=79782 RepID=A0A8I6SM55_CIMLE|nr:ejaculatory bulb-specific protein 3-like isoform X1 [Cimex lectularius]XP_024081407.1 ejaculatory bulb-specific protein 3-like isoform X2 [Cimex lectularius]
MDFKCSVFFCVVLCFVVAHAAEKYTTKYDNIDLDEILRNQRLYKNYFDCLRNQGKCTPDGKELKEALPDALANGCAKCSEKQRKGSEKVIKHLIENKSEDFKVLEKLYDPEGVYRKKYEKEAKELGIKV